MLPAGKSPKGGVIFRLLPAFLFSHKKCTIFYDSFPLGEALALRAYLPPTVIWDTRIRGWPTLVGIEPLEEPHIP